MRLLTCHSLLQLEFLQINISIVIFLVELELVIGTIPTNPWIRLVAMPSATICYYHGFVFIISTILTSLKWRLPFNLSSTPKGSYWRPVLFAIIEDWGAIELDGKMAFREQAMKRWELSPVFRRTVMVMSWVWGVGMIIAAATATVLLMVLPTYIGFGTGWLLPFAMLASLAPFTIWYVRRNLRIERETWSKGPSPGSSVESGVP